MLLDVLLVKQTALYPSNLLVNTSINIRSNDEHLVSRIKKPFWGGSRNDYFQDVRTFMSLQATCNIPTLLQNGLFYERIRNMHILTYFHRKCSAERLINDKLFTILIFF